MPFLVSRDLKAKDLGYASDRMHLYAIRWIIQRLKFKLEFITFSSLSQREYPKMPWSVDFAQIKKGNSLIISKNSFHKTAS